MTQSGPPADSWETFKAEFVAWLFGTERSTEKDAQTDSVTEDVPRDPRQAVQESMDRRG